MSDRVTPIAICLVLLVLGCEKKEAEKEAAPLLVRRGVALPAAMVPIREGVPVFITKKPVTVGEYGGYLQGTGQAMPERWRGLQPGAPVAGLTRKEAGRYAVWALKRLPTAQEWRQAAAVVGSRPYPWPEGAAPGAAGGDVFLVQDWPAGSDQELKARQAKAALPETILAEHKDEIAELRAQLQQATERHRTSREEQWKQLKPGFFALLEKQKELAGLRARQRAMADVLEILSEMAADKARLAVRLKTADLGPEAADAEVEAYEQKLADVRAKVQEVRQKLQQTTKELQDELVALTRRFEMVGATEVAAGLAAADVAVEADSTPPENIEQAARLAKELESALRLAGERRPAFEDFPGMDDIEGRMAQLDKQIEQISADQRLATEVETLRRKVAGLDQTINREFLQEKLLCQELDELAELRARMKAVEEKVDGLKEILGPASGAGVPAQ